MNNAMLFYLFIGFLSICLFKFVWNQLTKDFPVDGIKLNRKNYTIVYNLKGKAYNKNIVRYGNFNEKDELSLLEKEFGSKVKIINVFERIDTYE